MMEDKQLVGGLLMEFVSGGVVFASTTGLVGGLNTCGAGGCGCGGVGPWVCVKPRCGVLGPLFS